MQRLTGQCLQVHAAHMLQLLAAYVLQLLAGYLLKLLTVGLKQHGILSACFKLASA